MANDETDLPETLRSAVEYLSGVSMDRMQVRRASSEPAQLQAQSDVQASEIHLATGQEQRLPHEAWHVVQRQAGRMKPTPPVGGETVKDHAVLEREADAMGALATAASPPGHAPDVQPRKAMGPKGREG